MESDYLLQIIGFQFVTPLGFKPRTFRTGI